MVNSGRRPEEKLNSSPPVIYMIIGCVWLIVVICAFKPAHLYVVWWQFYGIYVWQQGELPFCDIGIVKRLNIVLKQNKAMELYNLKKYISFIYIRNPCYKCLDYLPHRLKMGIFHLLRNQICNLTFSRARLWADDQVKSSKTDEARNYQAKFNMENF